MSAVALMNHSLTFAERVSAILTERGIQQKALVQWTGIPTSTLAGIVNGTTKHPGVYDVLKIAAALKVPPLSLVSGGDIPASALTPYDTNEDVRGVVDGLQELTERDRKKAVEFIGWMTGAIARTNGVPIRRTLPRALITLSDDERTELASALERASEGKLSPRRVGRSDVPVPLIATVAADPEGKISFQRTEEARDINRYHWDRGVRSLVKVEGSSMLDMGIVSGDLLYIRPSTEPHEGKAIVCTVRNVFYVKVYSRRDDGTIVLSSRHPSYGLPDIIIPADQTEDFEYMGEVFGRYGDL